MDKLPSACCLMQDLNVIVLAAAEAAVALAIFVVLFRHKETVNIDQVNLMKW